MHRRTKLSMAATAFLCLALLLSACSSGATPTQGSAVSGGETLPAPTASSAQSADDQTSSLTATRLYKDSGGHEIDIPKNPQRIVLQGNPIGDLLALGIQPVGIDRRFIEGSVYKDKEHTPAEDIGYPKNMETVLSLDPDLTMLSYILDKEYEEASKISPVVVFDGALPMKKRFPVIADIVGKKTEAEQLLANYNYKAEAMWNNLRDSGKIADGETAVILQYFWNRSMYVMKTGGLAELLYQPAGFAMDAKVKTLEPNSGPYIEVAEEAMHETLIGDHLFVLYTGDKEAKKSFDELVKSPLWKSLPAVKNGNVHFMEDKWNYNDMMTSGMLLDEFPKVISP